MSTTSRAYTLLRPSNTIVQWRMQLELPYPGTTGNHSVRHSRNGSYLTQTAKDYHSLVAMAVRGRRAPPGAITASWVFAPPDRRARDADNLMKMVKDALTRCGFWADDSNKVIRAGSWVWTDPVEGGVILLDVTSLSEAIKTFVPTLGRL